MKVPELVMPTDALLERVGLKKPQLIEATKQVNIRKVRHVHPDTGVESVYVSATDLIALLDREYEITESKEIAGVARILRQIAGKA